MAVEKDKSEAPNGMRSLTRAIAVFEQIQRYEHPRRLSAIAADMGMSSPTTLRILRVLQEAGLVSQTDKSYRLGPAVLPAARVFLENDPLPRVAQPILQQLSQATKLTASLYTRLGSERVLVERVVGETSLGYNLPQGRRLPLTAGAAGRILLRGADDDELTRIAESSRRLQYEAENFDLEAIRVRTPRLDSNYAISEDERALGIISIAVAVPARQGLPTEALSLTGPIATIPRDTLEAKAPELLQAARRLSDLLASSVY
ncbi:DNA-binding IclR family transcriptional regulator [Arthrobacter sp. JUb119]|uniref:IclR family transcriptional regulator n=1 Tax=Micrococcales TaxID=85006 RepID=UPI000FB93D9A|nr:IclR family transcriptional regulator [Arthrobacter sp. JUb115]MCS3494702.1 DNA-binding IclR family transcriptional regulator [Arthrobacter sp. JUb119]TDU18157.1 IclR family transcriptional regulator [Arthrobacter sp. JUb115]